MIYNFEDLRPVSTYPKYPPYVTSDKGYIETYFYDFFLKYQDKFAEKKKVLIPIWWTTLAVENARINVQEYLNVLPKNVNWFAVSQHDDGIRWQLPPNTLHFAAGGLGGGIPIPLVCQPITEYANYPIAYKHKPENHFCSFIGSNTHPIRHKLLNTLANKEDVYLSPNRPWSQTVEEDKLKDFITRTIYSRFALAPRGYGLSSFRLYEIMQLGTVPVYVSDKHWLPWQDELNWEEFCVIVKENEIDSLYDRLKSISDVEHFQMLLKMREVYPKYFSLLGMSDQILKRL